MKYLALIGAVALLAGCRGVVSNSSVANTFTAGNDIVLKDSGTKGRQEAIQAADKKVGDIAPKAAVAAGPASKVDTKDEAKTATVIEVPTLPPAPEGLDELTPAE